MTRSTPIPEIVTNNVPFRVVKRGGRKKMVLPKGAEPARKPDHTLVKSRAHAFRWKRMLESREFATIAELADREGNAPSYMTRVLRMTLLAPDFVEAILDGRHGTEVTLALLLQPFPEHWQTQTFTAFPSFTDGQRIKRKPTLVPAVAPGHSRHVCTVVHSAAVAASRRKSAISAGLSD